MHVAAAVSGWLAKALQRPWVRRVLSLNGLLFGDGLRALASRFDTEKARLGLCANSRKALSRSHARARLHAVLEDAASTGKGEPNRAAVRASGCRISRTSWP